MLLAPEVVDYPSPAVAACQSTPQQVRTRHGGSPSDPTTTVNVHSPAFHELCVKESAKLDCLGRCWRMIIYHRDPHTLEASDLLNTKPCKHTNRVTLPVDLEQLLTHARAFVILSKIEHRVDAQYPEN